jgi:hypothetical protein
MQATLFNIVVASYFVIALAKFILCAPHLPMVIGVMSRLSGAPRGKIRGRYIIFVPLLMLFTSFFGWISALKNEGISFFFLYSRLEVMRDCVRAHRQHEGLRG